MPRKKPDFICDVFRPAKYSGVWSLNPFKQFALADLISDETAIRYFQQDARNGGAETIPHHDRAQWIRQAIRVKTTARGWWQMAEYARERDGKEFLPAPAPARRRRHPDERPRLF